MAFGRQPIFRGTQATTTTVYYPLPVYHGEIGFQFAWTDAISAGTVTLEYSNFDAIEAPYDVAGAAYEWKDSAEVIAGPAATAAGSTIVTLTNKHVLRARIKFVTTANSSIVILNGVDVP
jgi:hypothetical protein